MRTPGRFEPTSTPPVTPQAAWNQKPSSSEKKEPRAQLRKRSQFTTHQRWHSTGGKPAQQLKVEQAEKPLKTEKVTTADGFVTWLRNRSDTRRIDEKIGDTLLNDNAIRNELIPQINRFTVKQIAVALDKIREIQTGEPKSVRLHDICLGALWTREDALKQPVLSTEAKVDASKTLQVLKAEGAQLLKAYVTALVEGDEQATVAPMKRLAEIREQITLMDTGKHRQKVIPAVISSWIKGLALAEPDKEKIYQRAIDFEFEREFGKVREGLLDTLEREINEMLAQAFISAARDGDKAEIKQAAVKLQEHCLRRDADPTREDLRERLKGILEDCLKQHPLSADDKKNLRANLPHRSESEAVKILRDLVKGESKVPPLMLKLHDLASSIPSPRSPDSPFKSPRKKAPAASAPAQQPLSLAASAPPAPRPDPKGVAMDNFIFQLIAEDLEGIETSFYELRQVILSLEVEMNALDPLIDAALKDTPTEGLETIAPLIEKGFGVQDVVFKEVQQRLSGRVWAELIVRRLLEHPDVNENADLEAAYNALNDYLDHDERDLERDVKVQLLFSRALGDRSKEELEILATVQLEKKNQIDKGLMNALLLHPRQSEELIRKKKT